MSGYSPYQAEDNEDECLIEPSALGSEEQEPVPPRSYRKAVLGVLVLSAVVYSFVSVPSQRSMSEGSAPLAQTSSAAVVAEKAGAATKKESNSDTVDTVSDGSIVRIFTSLRGDANGTGRAFFQESTSSLNPGPKGPTATTPTVIVSVDSTVKYQQLLGFGGAFTESAGYNIFKLNKTMQDQVYGLYFGSPASSLGYTVMRTHINSCDYSLKSYSCDDVAGDYALNNFTIAHDHIYLLPMVKEAMKFAAKTGVPAPYSEIKLFGSPWSPPAWMKRNDEQNWSLDPGLKEDPVIHDTWARFMSKWVTEWKKEGVPVWGLSVQNEPANAAPWEACVYSAEDERDFVKQYLGPTLKKDHPELKLIFWDHNRDLMTQRAHVMYSDPEAAQYVDGIGIHWYVGNSPALTLYGNLDKVHTLDPSKFILGTEATFCPGVKLGDWSRGETYSFDILNDLEHWAVGWLDWNIALDTTGGPNHLNNMCDSPIIIDGDTGTFQVQPIYYHIGHFSKFIQPGATRVKTTVSQGLTCRLKPSSEDYEKICSSVLWACHNGIITCDPQYLGCMNATKSAAGHKWLRQAADIIFDDYYQQKVVAIEAHEAAKTTYSLSDVGEGPMQACDFSGQAALEGLQVTSWENPDGTMAVVVFNIGENSVDYVLELTGFQRPGFVNLSIPSHAIASIVL